MDLMAENAQAQSRGATEHAAVMVYWIDEMLTRMTCYPADSALHSQRDELTEARRRAVQGAAHLDGASIALQRASVEIQRIMREESQWRRIP